MKKLYLALLCLTCLGFAVVQTTLNFNYSGSQQSFVVPPCVTSISIQAFGAQGTAGLNTQGGQGGLGGSSTGTLTVTPGQTLYIYVGGQGGFNGGGAPGAGGPFASGSGGGASDVRVIGTTLN